MRTATHYLYLGIILSLIGLFVYRVEPKVDIQADIKLLEIPITAFLAYIALQNYRVEKHKLRFELFEKRHRLYETVRELLKSAMIHGVPLRPDLHLFVANSSDVAFLFEKDVQSYVENLRDKALRAIHLQERLERGTDDTAERANIARELESLERWLHAGLTNTQELFGKYLNFKKI